MRTRAAASVLFGLLLAWTTSLGAQTPEPLAQLVADWEAAFNAGDLDDVVALYTSDAIRAPPQEELISGPDEIKAGLEESAGLTIKLTTAGGLLGDEVGSTWGYYELSGTVGGESIEEKGRWMNAVMKTSDGWKIYRDMWHESEPAEGGCM